MNQWPHPLSYEFKKKGKLFSEKKLNFIEDFFSKKYKVKYALLCPSTRSSINLILTYLKFSRAKTVAIPKWSSHCLFQSIGAITNISVGNFEKSHCILSVHKWGNTYKFKSKNQNSIIIEDSADCLPNEKYLPFENNSKFEVISLPKIIASFSGGIILTNNKKFYKYGKRKQKENRKLGIEQSKKKYYSLVAKKLKIKEWFYDESFNTSFDKNTIDNVFSCIDFFDKNLKIIKLRQKLIKKIIPNINFDKKRLGPCAIFPKKKYPSFKKIFEIKHFDFSKNLKTQKYEKCFIFPIHFRISDKIFKRKIAQMRKAYKS